MRSLRCRDCGWTWVDFDDGCPGCRPDWCPICQSNDVTDLSLWPEQLETEEEVTT